LVRPVSCVLCPVVVGVRLQLSYMRYCRCISRRALFRFRSPTLRCTQAVIQQVQLVRLDRVKCFDVSAHFLSRCSRECNRHRHAFRIVADVRTELVVPPKLIDPASHLVSPLKRLGSPHPGHAYHSLPGLFEQKSKKSKHGTAAGGDAAVGGGSSGSAKASKAKSGGTKAGGGSSKNKAGEKKSPAAASKKKEGSGSSRCASDFNPPSVRYWRAWARARVAAWVDLIHSMWCVFHDVFRPRLGFRTRPTSAVARARGSCSAGFEGSLS